MNDEDFERVESAHCMILDLLRQLEELTGLSRLQRMLVCERLAYVHEQLKPTALPTEAERAAYAKLRAKLIERAEHTRALNEAERAKSDHFQGRQRLALSASPLFERLARMSETIPNGPARGTPLDAAAEKDIRFWIGRKEKDVADDPNGRWSQKNKAWIAAAKAELERRAKGGAVAKPPAGSNGSAIQLQQAPAIQALGHANHDATAVTESLRKLAENYHLIAPASSVDVLPPGCGVAISAVLVDTNPSNGDIYKVGDKFGLSGVVLSKIWAARGGSWDPRMSGRLDDGSDPHYCHFRAVGTALNFDGSVQVVTGEVEIDAREGSPLIDEIRAKAKAREAKADYKGHRDGGAAQILELRKFLMRHAERKAKNRAIADLGIARAYTQEQLAKPFAVTRLMFTGESDDPILRRAFADKIADRMLSSRSLLYGDPTPQQPPPAAHALPAPAAPFRGHAPPGISLRPTHDTTGEPPPAQPAPAKPTPAASAAAPSNGAPTPEELAESERSDDPQATDFGGDDDIPF